ncbi:hypothetical protein LJR230_001358 [Trinickia sp. LjRoot230]|uniref:hypothetical protein n=1 Tax=Trinickia sp. LjRoot230 TaxID=3342288 RepID=UPI003ECD77E0
MELSAIGRAGREQAVVNKAGANSAAVASTTSSQPRRLIGALGNLGRDAWATVSTIGARGPRFAYSSSGEEKLPAQGYFPGISDEEISEADSRGEANSIHEHQLPVLPEERDSKLNRHAHGAPQAAVHANGLPSGIALRGGPDEVHKGDGSIFDKVIAGATDKCVAVGEAAEADGASPEEADVEANKAIGTINPQANFSATAIAALSAVRESLPGIALRGADSPRENNPQIDQAQAGDGSSFGEVIEALEDKEYDAYKGALDGGASTADAQTAADKELGRADPKANFSAHAAAVDTSTMSKVRRLATALRPSGLHMASNEARTTPRLQFPAARAPRFA